MTNAINTRAPWDVDGQFGFLDVVSSKGRIAMIDCDNDDIFGADIEANARLIAAAPDLLAALEVMAAHWPHWASQIDMKQIDRDAIAMARAAIAKAKGA
jgi:hypothetical protein